MTDQARVLWILRPRIGIVLVRANNLTLGLGFM